MSVWKLGEKLLVFASSISASKSFCLRSNTKHSTQCFIIRWNTSKFVKNTPLRVVFSTLFSVFHLRWNTASHAWCITYILPASCCWSFTWPLNLCTSFVKAQGCNGDETAFLIDTCVHKSGLPCEITKARVKRRTLLYYKNVRFRVEPGQFLFSGQFQPGNVLTDVLKFNNGNVITFKLNKDKIRKWLKVFSQ